MSVHVCLVGIDGLRIADALAGTDAPVLQALISTGSFARMEMEVPTISGPGWASLLTGAPHKAHGIKDNTFAGSQLLDHPDLLSQGWFADQSTTTWAAVSWLPLADPGGPGPVIWWREEAQRAGRHAIVLRDGETFGYGPMDGEVVAWSKMAIRERGPQMSFIYLGEVDLAGHVYGGVSPEYRDAVQSADARLGELLGTIAERARTHRDESWLVAVTTDHGHRDEGGHGGAEPVERRSFLAAQWLRHDGTARPDLTDPIEPTQVTPYLLSFLGSSPTS